VLVEKGVRISVSKANRSFSAAPNQSVLDAALDAGLNLPHSCKSGACGACRARLLTGEVDYPNGPPLGLTAVESSEGLILLCQAHAGTDLSLELFDVSLADQALIKRLPCRIDRVEQWSQDVMGMFVRLPAAERFDFLPGQYIDFLLPGGRRRSFSIASPPHDSRLLELHVRRVSGGEFTEPLFSEPLRGGLLTMQGPFGHFVYRSPEPRSRANDAPMLLLGGGTGLAPLKSILRHVIENGLDREMTLYWGVRDERDLYARVALEQMARRAANFRWVPVLSDAAPGWAGRRGWVHEAVLGDIEQLARYEVYASGPPAMIEAVRREFALRGVPPTRLLFDSFDYAPDSLARQRTMASTKS
jgi:CDP-4-dehydro-6-deoxyglucose reductase